MALAAIDQLRDNPPSTGVFSLAREILDRLHQPGLTKKAYREIARDAHRTITAGQNASTHLFRETIPEDLTEADLTDTARDGMRYHAAEALLEKATRRMDKKMNDMQFSDDNIPDPKHLVELELDALHRRLFDGWKPSGDNVVSKVFREGQGQETLSMLLQIYAIACNGEADPVDAELIARDIHIKHGRGENGTEKVKITIPAGVLAFASQHEAGKGRAA